MPNSTDSPDSPVPKNRSRYRSQIWNGFHSLYYKFFPRNMTSICIQCKDGKEFPDLRALQEHIKEVHVSSRRQTFRISPSTVKESEKVKATTPRTMPTPVIEEKLKEIAANPVNNPPDKTKKPITLTYKYSGECPIDGIPVDTLEMEVGGEPYVIAWCNSCRRKIEDLKVIPISFMRGGYDKVKRKGTGKTSS